MGQTVKPLKTTHENSREHIRVLHITPSSKLGGGPEHLWQLVQNLPHHIESFIAAPCREPYWDRFLKAVGEERLIRIPQRRFSVRALWRLWRWAKAQNIQVVHSHGKGGGIYGRLLSLLLGKPSVHTFHGIHLPGSAPLAFIYLTLERFLCAVSRVCIAVSPGEKKLAESLKLGTGHLALVPNGVAVPETITPTRREPFEIVHVTRFDPVKNTPWLLPLAATLQKQGKQNFRFVIIGDGNGLEAMKKDVTEAGLAPHFTFTGEQTSVRPFFRGAGCYVSCSLREGLPLAVLEAQAEGVPCIVSDVTGNRDAVMDKETGFTFPLGDIDTAVQRLTELMDDTALWQRMSNTGHERVQKQFSVTRMAVETAELYKLTRP